jgi:hypothetical protein
MDRQAHLIDPMTHPSSGDPPADVTAQGERLGVIPVTRNAVADHAQAEQEGLDAAKSGSKTKAEKQSDKRHHANDKQRRAPEGKSVPMTASEKREAGPK